MYTYLLTKLFILSMYHDILKDSDVTELKIQINQHPSFLHILPSLLLFI